MTEEKLLVKREGEFNYPIYFEKDFSYLAEAVKTEGFAGCKMCIVADSNVAPLYASSVKEELQKMAETLLAHVKCQKLTLEIKETRTVAGGGTTPGKSQEGVAVRIRCSLGTAGAEISAQELSECFRDCQIPVLGYIEEDWFYLEMRTIGKDEILQLANVIQVIEKSLR